MIINSGIERVRPCTFPQIALSSLEAHFFDQLLPKTKNKIGPYMV